MPKEEWGVKRVCPTTGKRFYDLNKTPIVSPYTGEVVELDTGKTRSITADTEDAETKKQIRTAANESRRWTKRRRCRSGRRRAGGRRRCNVSLDDIADVSDDNES